MELLDRLLPAPPAQLLDVGGGPGTYGRGPAGAAAGGRLLAMAVCRFASLLDGLYKGWLDDP